jgi:hypothetical protein
MVLGLWGCTSKILSEKSGEHGSVFHFGRNSAKGKIIGDEEFEVLFDYKLGTHSVHQQCPECSAAKTTRTFEQKVENDEEATGSMHRCVVSLATRRTGGCIIVFWRRCEVCCEDGNPS